MRGPLTASRLEKATKGEHRPSKVNYNEPVLDAPSVREPPGGLEGPGLEEWTRLIDHLIERGVLTTGDLKVLEHYCRALMDLRRFQDAAWSVTPALAIKGGYQATVIKLRTQITQLQAHLGLTALPDGCA